MSTDDDCPVAAPRHGHDNGLMRPECVWEGLSGHPLLLRLQKDILGLKDILDLGQEPLRRLSSGHRLREAGVVGGVLLQVLPDAIPVELGKQASDVLLVFEIGWVWSWDLNYLDLGVEVCDIEEVAATTTALHRSAMVETQGYVPLTDESSHRSSSVICTV